MYKRMFLSAVAAMTLLGACAVSGGQSAVTIPGSHEVVSYMGRTAVTSDSAVRFNYPGVTARLGFSGSQLDMLTNPGSGFWMVSVDDSPAVKMEVAQNDSVLSLTGLADGEHTARLTYCIEGFEHNPEIRGFRVPGGNRFFNTPDSSARRIEFIGNSITCGFGTEADNAEAPFTYDTENHCLSYAYLTARELNANFNMVCRSGIGIYRNAGSPREGDAEKTMPDEYDYTMLYDHSVPWDHTRFSPDIICINLGTNDTSGGNYDIERFENRYNGFLDHLRQLHPDAKIVLLTGSMMHGRELDDVKGVLDRLAKSREGVYRFDMTPQDGEAGYGAGYHPSAAQSRKMAAELTPFLWSIQ